MARAVVDRGFRVRLLTDPVDALTDYGLCEHEAQAVESLRANSLAEFVARFLGLSTLSWRPEIAPHHWTGESQ